MSTWSLRDSISLPSFNGTNVWFAPNAPITPINSTEAFHHASDLEEGAYLANRYLFIALMVVMCAFVLHSMPYVAVRMRWTRHWHCGWRLSRSGKTDSVVSQERPPRRLTRLNLRWIPTYTVP